MNKAFNQAIINVRTALKPVIKDRRGQYPYASLGAMQEAIDHILKAEGIGYYATLSRGEHPTLDLVITFDGSDPIVSSYPLFTERLEGKRNIHQEMGAALSYAMRHLFRSFFMIDADDNDPDTIPAVSTPHRSFTLPSEKKDFKANPNNPISEKQVSLINKLLQMKNIDSVSYLEKYAISTMSDLNSAQASEIIDDIKNR